MSSDPIDKVCGEFEELRGLLEELCPKTKILIEDCLKDAGLRYQSIQARVKRKDKLRAKYLDTSKNYTKLTDITDLAAFRVITYYEDEVERVAEVIKREFSINPGKSPDRRVTDPDRFGYRAFNLVCTLSPQRKADVQFKAYADLLFEIQVTSVLGHAWAEIEHEWYDLRDSYPDNIKRRFSRLAALFEIADAEFTELRNRAEGYRRSVGVQVEADISVDSGIKKSGSGIPLDSVSLAATIAGDPIISLLDVKISELLGLPLADELNAADLDQRVKTVRAVGIETVHALRESLERYQGSVPEFLRRALLVLSDDRQALQEVPRGTSVYQLTLFLAASEGTDGLRRMLDAAGVSLDPVKEAGLAALAREMLSSGD